MSVAADTYLVGQAAGTERSGRRQPTPTVEAMTACTALATAAWVASADAARMYEFSVRFYKQAISKIIGVAKFSKSKFPNRQVASDRQSVTIKPVTDLMALTD